MIERRRFRDGRQQDIDHGPGVVERGPQYAAQLRDVEDREQRRPVTTRVAKGLAIKWR